MRKYIETAKVMFKAQLAYRFDILLSIVFTVSKILLAYVLWGAIFGEQDEISGFSFNSMLSYYIISSFITQLDQSAATGGQMAGEIRDGLFSKYIVKPMSTLGYFSAQTAGISAFLLSFKLAAALVWVFVFGVDFTVARSAFSLAYAGALVFLGLIFMMQLNYFIGILAFKFVDTYLFFMIKDNIVQFITGSLIPLTLLPSGIIRLMSFFPFYYVSYLPSMLLLGRNGNEAAAGVVILIIWNIAFGLINTLTFKKLKSNYEGVGI